MGAEIATLRDEQVQLPPEVMTRVHQQRAPTIAMIGKGLLSSTFRNDTAAILAPRRRDEKQTDRDEEQRQHQQGRHYNELARLAEALLDKDQENAELRRQLVSLKRNLLPLQTTTGVATMSTQDESLPDPSIPFLRHEISPNTPPNIAGERALSPPPPPPHGCGCHCGAPESTPRVRNSHRKRVAGFVQVEEQFALQQALEQALRERDEARKLLVEEQERSASELQAYSRSLQLVDELRREATRHQKQTMQCANRNRASSVIVDASSTLFSTENDYDDNNSNSSSNNSSSNNRNNNSNDNNNSRGQQEQTTSPSPSPSPTLPLKQQGSSQKEGQNDSSGETWTKATPQSFWSKFPAVNDLKGANRLWAPIVDTILATGGGTPANDKHSMLGRKDEVGEKNDKDTTSNMSRPQRASLPQPLKSEDYDPFDTAFSIDDEQDQEEDGHCDSTKSNSLDGGVDRPTQEKHAKSLRAANEGGETGVRHRTLSPLCAKLGRESSSSCLSVKD